MKFFTFKSKMAHEPIICDTDAGSDVDDFLALAYLINAAPGHLKLISTTYGPVETRAKAVATLLAAMKVRIPIVTGVKKLLTPNAPPMWLTGGEDHLIDPDIHYEDKDLLESYLQYDHFTVLAIGPPTNVATLLQHPEFVRRCSRIIIMGGSINPNPENGIPEIEHNFRLDPLATKIVMESPIPKVLIPVDLTVAIPMTEMYQALFHNSNHPYGLLLSGWIKNWRKITNSFEPPFYDSVHWHDPIAAAYIFHPDLFETEVMRFRVRQDGALIKGSGIATLVCTKMEPKLVDIMTRAILGRTIRKNWRLIVKGPLQYFKKKTTKAIHTTILE